MGFKYMTVTFQIWYARSAGDRCLSRYKIFKTLIFNPPTPPIHAEFVQTSYKRVCKLRHQTTPSLVSLHARHVRHYEPSRCSSTLCGSPVYSHIKRRSCVRKRRKKQGPLRAIALYGFVRGIKYPVFGHVERRAN